MPTLGQVYHLVGAQEIAEMLGISRQRFTQLATRADFPQPVAELAQGPVWETAAIREWARKTGRLVDEDDKPEPRPSES